HNPERASVTATKSILTRGSQIQTMGLQKNAAPNTAPTEARPPKARVMPRTSAELPRVLHRISSLGPIRETPNVLSSRAPSRYVTGPYGASTMGNGPGAGYIGLPCRMFRATA